jgi:uncharacterized repeat protein (TIGR01451 family)
LPGQSIQIPVTITNTGNKDDKFRVETDLAVDYQPLFSISGGNSEAGLPVFVTGSLARGATTELILSLRIPPIAVDGQQRNFSVRAISESDSLVTRAISSSIRVVAPAVVGSSTLSQNSIMPGETLTQTISIRNSGSTVVSAARVDFVFNPSFEVVDSSVLPTYDKESHIAIWRLGDLPAGETKNITVTLRASNSALAATNSIGRGMIQSPSLSSRVGLESTTVSVGKVFRVRIDAVSTGLTGKPGEVLYFPFVVRNSGNTQDSFELRVSAPGAPSPTMYADTNSDGQHQDSEPVITQTQQIDPQGQFGVLLKVNVPSDTEERQQFSYNVAARSLSNTGVAGEASSVLTVIVPRVRVRTEQINDASAPGDTIFYRLVLVNEGSGSAKSLVVTESLPDALQFVSAEPALSSKDGEVGAQRFVWRLAELAPGETSVLRVAVKLRAGVNANTSLTTRHSLAYQDSSGNRYRGQ